MERFESRAFYITKQIYLEGDLYCIGDFEGTFYNTVKVEEHGTPACVTKKCPATEACCVCFWTEMNLLEKVRTDMLVVDS